MRGLLRSIGGTVIAGAMILTSLSSVFAGTSVTKISKVNVNNSYINTIVSQSDSTIKASGGDVDIVEISDKKIKNSVVGTGVFESKSTIKAKGKNVKVTSADELGVDGSYVDMLVNDSKSKIKTYSR